MILSLHRKTSFFLFSSISLTVLSSAVVSGLVSKDSVFGIPHAIASQENGISGMNNQSIPSQSKADQLKAVCKTLATFPSNNLTDNDCNNLSIDTISPTNGSLATVMERGFMETLKDLIRTKPIYPNEPVLACNNPPCETIPK